MNPLFWLLIVGASLILTYEFIALATNAVPTVSELNWFAQDTSFWWGLLILFGLILLIYHLYFQKRTKQR